jgi:hypothetical protein
LAVFELCQESFRGINVLAVNRVNAHAEEHILNNPTAPDINGLLTNEKGLRNDSNKFNITL